MIFLAKRCIGIFSLAILSLLAACGDNEHTPSVTASYDVERSWPDYFEEHRVHYQPTVYQMEDKPICAQENTRASIWDAMARKEVYATTGSRLKVRVFAGWDFEADGANLDRLQIIKGWLDGTGNTHERVYTSPIWFTPWDGNTMTEIKHQYL
jgi:Protein of unknown function (DUF3604)